MLLRAIALILLLAPCAIAAEPDRILMLPERAENPVVLAAETPYGTAMVRYHSPKVYLLDNKKYFVANFVETVAIENEGTMSIAANGLCVVAGKPVPIIAKSLSEGLDMSELNPDLSVLYVFNKTGAMEIGLDIGVSHLRIPVEVIDVPFKAGDTAVDLVAKYGLPSSKKPFSVFWPDTKRVDAIIYSPEAGEGAKIGEHWTFDGLPGAIFSIQRGQIAGICSWLPFFEPKDNKVPIAEQVENNINPGKAKIDPVELGKTKKELEDELIATQRGRINRRLDREREVTYSRLGAKVIVWQSTGAKKNAIHSLKLKIDRIEAELAKIKPEKTLGDHKVGVKFREWSDTTGQFKLDATLVKVDGETIVLQKKDGQQISVPLEKMSKSDVEYVRKVE